MSDVNPAARSARWFIWPCLAVLLLTSVYPTVFGLMVSLTDWNWGGRLNYVGLGNYRELLGSAEYWTVLYNTLFFAVFACGLEVTLGFYLAVQVDKLPFNTGLIRVLLMLPLMVSGIVVALMSKVVFDGFLGIANYFLAQLGTGPWAFFGAADTAMWTVIGVDVWWQTAFVFIIMLAGLQSLPKDPLEAARVEGATPRQIFWRIKFPLLRPLLITVIIIRSIDTLKVFDIVFGTTGGGPNLATEVMQTLAYRSAYGFLQIGRSMTIMVLFAALILIICLLYERIKDD